MKYSNQTNNNLPHTNSNKKDKVFLKASGSVLLAIIASSHHWLHTLLLALGLTTLGTSLLSLSPFYRLIFLSVSLIFSIWFIIVARKKWKSNRPAAWVYLISSIISIVLVFTSVPQVLTELLQENIQNEDIENPSEHQEHHP